MRRIPVEEIAADATHQIVTARPAQHPIIPRIPAQEVMAFFAFEGVVVSPAEEDVVADVALDAVDAGTPIEMAVNPGA